MFAKQLAGVGFDQFEKISLADLDLGSADLKRHGPPTNRFQPAAFKIAAGSAPGACAWRAPGRRISDQQQAVRDLIARAVKAKGGLDRLRSIRTVKAVATTTMVGGAAGPVTFDTTSYIEYPGSFRLDAKTASGEVIKVFSGGECWVKDGRGLRSASAEEADQMRSTVQRDVIGLLLALADGRVPATRLPDVVEQGRGLTALGVGGAMQPVVLLLDPATDLIRAQRLRRAGWSDRAGDG